MRALSCATAVLFLGGVFLTADGCGGPGSGNGDPVDIRLNLIPEDTSYAPQTLDAQILPAAGEATLSNTPLQRSTLFQGTVMRDDPGAGTFLPSSATLLLTRDGVGSRGVLASSDGTFTLDIDDGVYDLRIFPIARDEVTFFYGPQSLDLPTPPDESFPLLQAEKVLGRILQESADGGPSQGVAYLTVEPVQVNEDGTVQLLGPIDQTDADTGYFGVGLTEDVTALRISSPDSEGPPLPTVILTGLNLPDDLTSDEEEIPTLYTYPEIPSITIANQVLDPASPSSGGVADAEVRLLGTVSFTDVEGTPQEAPFSRRVHTDDQGRFAVQVPDGLYTLTVVPGYAPTTRLSPLAVGNPPIPAADLSGFPLQLPLRTALSGVVSYEEDPVEGAEISVRSRGPSGYSWLTTSGPDGTWSVYVDAGPIEVRAIPPSDSPAAPLILASQEVSGTSFSLDLALPQAVRVSGQVTSNNTPLYAVGVQILDPEEGTFLGEGISDESGYFEIRISRDWVESR